MSYRGPNQFQNQFGAPHQQYPSNIPPQPHAHIGPISTSKSPLEQFEQFSKKVEDGIDDYFKPLKPYVPAIGRAFLVATFYEDTIRIFSQWSEQVYYLHNYRRYWRWLTVAFLVNNMLIMSIASTLVIIRKKNNIATVALIFVVIIQGVAYGLLFDPQFILRNLSVVGGLVLAFSDTIVRDKRSLNMPGLPMLNNQDNKKYFLLAGRILLVLLFLGFVFSSKWSIGRVVIILMGLVSCTSIIVGYKTKFAAAMILLMLFFYNIFTNQFWAYESRDARRDFLRYEFFQVLSIVGGLLLVVNAGAGEFSIDEKKKIY
ncbi:ERV29 [Candida oxycetoniae]|uniref:ERV29 n=1 Tax=Candida oxycetoniae TaxID=497107 RepID=A0AAI9STS5_9ASCO|nr:ERV29 [Candida oxycetoniae]KAI3402730.1 ERV29 [Candida oxycetoniae]